MPIRIKNLFLLFIFWLMGVYLLVFFLCSYVHIKESNIIANRADELLQKLVEGEKSALEKITTVQNMTRKISPIFFEPSVVFKCLFGGGENYKAVNLKLSNAVESIKDDLDGVTFGQVYLQDLNLDNADLRRTNLANSNLSRSSLREANLVFAKLNGANFQGANFQNAILFQADFSGALLRGANFFGANLSAANLAGADLRESTLAGARGIYCAQIKSSLIDKDTRFPDYIVIEESSKPISKCINLLKEKGMDLSGINLTQAYLRGGQFRYVNLSEANLKGANFQDANLRDVNFTEADLSDANLKGVDFEDANFRNANLKSANLQDANISDANFTGAILSGANLEGVKGVTCAQINSSMITDKTRFPEYISVAIHSGSNYKCKNAMNKKLRD